MDKKRKKTFYHHPSKRNKPGIEVGMKGFLLTCNSHEDKCLREGYLIMNQTADKIYPRNEEKSKNDAELDIEASLEKELEQERKKQTYRFQQVFTHCKNVIFVDIKDPQINPIKLTDAVFDEIKNSGEKPPVMHLLRFIPIIKTCKATPESVTKAIEEVLESKDSDLLNELTIEEGTETPTKSCTYKVEAKVRNNDSCTQHSMIDAVCPIIKKLRPEWKVDLKNPRYTIVVDVLNLMACISILKNFSERRKYNIGEYARQFTKEIELSRSSANIEKTSDVKPDDGTNVHKEISEPIIVKNEN